MDESPFPLPEPLEPEALERTFRQLEQDDQVEAFALAIQLRYAQEPANLLLAAWHARLTYPGRSVRRRMVAWRWAIPLALLNGLLFWWLSDDRYMFRLPGDLYGYMPWLVAYWMPIAAAFVLVYFSLAGRARWRRTLTGVAGLAVLSLYLYGASQWMVPRVAIEQYLNLGAIHLPILALAGIGFVVLAGAKGVADRFALLMKMLEVVILAGMFALVGGVFVGITAGLFNVLGVNLPEWVMRLLVAGGAGLIPLLATAILYDPTRAPGEQSFDEGLSKVIALILRLILPLILVVLAVYLVFIPFNFRAPLTNRDVLIIYNVMLFAVMLLLLGVTPAGAEDLSRSQARWLRRGILALAALAVLVGGYALFAIAYRTWRGGLTPNRLAFMGWNVVNIGLLLHLLASQRRVGSEGEWVPALKRVFARGAVVYALWALVVVLATPWLFGRPPGPAFAELPRSVQRAVYGEGYPVLLKCDSPHIYLLERGRKRWVKDIPTFRAQGFRWRDVRFVSCEDLRRIPDGPPIPPDAGPPPAPYSRYGPAPTPILAPTPTTLPGR